ncbi:MAG: hypothetical protein WBX22_09030 [Silvibacterium sp.]|jgi:hypothetical protein
MNLRRLLLPLLAALLAVSIKTAPAQTPSSPIQQIAVIRHEWMNDWKSKNLEGLRTLHAQNTVILPAVGTWVEGRDAIGDYLRQVIDSSGNSIIVPDAPNGSGEGSGDRLGSPSS